MRTNCCNSCGMLTCNNDLSKKCESEFPWYSQENMDRLWENVQDSGQYLICHSTDPNAKKYEGEEGIKPGNEMACIGFTFWVYMHIKIFEHLESYGKYKNAVGHKVALSRRVLGDMIFDMAIGNTSMYGNGLKIPRAMSEERELRVPSGFEKTVKLFSEIVGEKTNFKSPEKTKQKLLN
jgi:hypothetical protein